MTIPAAAHCLSEPEDKVADCLASLASFRTWTNTADAAEAKDRIYHDIILTADEEREDTLARERLEQVRPYAQIYWDTFSLVRTAHQSTYGAPTFELKLDFEDNFPEQYRSEPRAAERAFKNSIGEIVYDLFQACTGHPYQELAALRMTQGVGRCDPKEVQSKGDFLFIQFTIQLGGGR